MWTSNTEDFQREVSAVNLCVCVWREALLKKAWKENRNPQNFPFLFFFFRLLLIWLLLLVSAYLPKWKWFFFLLNSSSSEAAMKGWPRHFIDPFSQCSPREQRAQRVKGQWGAKERESTQLSSDRLSLFSRQHWVLKQCLHGTLTITENRASI